ncbi:MAG: hypothetical protein SGPRY_002302 [Prymnesium sp.]
MARLECRVSLWSVGLSVLLAAEMLLCVLSLSSAASFSFRESARSVHLARFLTNIVNALLFSAGFPHVGTKASDLRTRVLSSTTCMVGAMGFVLLCACIYLVPHPFWIVVVFLCEVMTAPSTCVCVRYAAGYGTDFWREVRASLFVSGCSQILRSLLFAILGIDNPILPPGEKSLTGASAFGGFTLLLAFVTKPSFRLAFSNTCGISLYILHLAILDTPSWLKPTEDGTSPDVSESEYGFMPAVLETFPSSLRWRRRIIHTASSSKSGSLRSLASSDDFSPFTMALAVNVPRDVVRANEGQADATRGIVGARHVEFGDSHSQMLAYHTARLWRRLRLIYLGHKDSGSPLHRLPKELCNRVGWFVVQNYAARLPWTARMSERTPWSRHLKS